MEWLAELGAVALTHFWIPIGIWTVTAIPLFVLLIFYIRNNPALQYHVCLALLFALPMGFLVMPAIQLIVSHWLSPSYLMEFSMIVTGITAVTEMVAPLEVATEGEILEVFRLNIMHITGILTAVVVLLTIGRMGKLTFQLFRLYAYQKELQAIKSPTAYDMLAELKDLLGIKRAVKLTLGPANMSPMTFGVLWPIISIPGQIIHEPKTLRVALMHELVHIKRWDFGWSLLAKLTLVVFGFHPLVRYIGRQMTVYREVSCDHETLRNISVHPPAYARMLLRFNSPAIETIAMSMIRRKSILKQRIEIMMNDKKRPFKASNSRGFVLVSLLIPVFCLAGFTSVHSIEGLSPLPEEERYKIEIRSHIEGEKVEFMASYIFGENALAVVEAQTPYVLWSDDFNITAIIQSKTKGKDLEIYFYQVGSDGSEPAGQFASSGRTHVISTELAWDKETGKPKKGRHGVKVTG